MTRLLSLNDVLAIHESMISEFGGAAGIRDMGLLESAMYRMSASFGGEDFYPELWQKCGALLHSIIRNHPFVDGNCPIGVRSALGSL